MKDKNSRELLARGIEAALFHGLCSDDGFGTRRQAAGGGGSSLPQGHAVPLRGPGKSSSLSHSFSHPKKGVCLSSKLLSG